jgi:hypothetical protein
MPCTLDEVDRGLGHSPLGFRLTFASAVPIDAPTARGCDAIGALLEGSQDTDSGDLVVSARVDLGPQGGDLSDVF